MMRKVTFSRISSLLRRRYLSTSNISITIKEAVQTNQLDQIDIESFRNFSIIAHVDHGKSTLADAILQLTGNINEEDARRGQVLDNLQVERERGITVKAQTASMIYTDSRTNKRYLINLIDTPGHVDFSYEVVRSLASCQGALLLVDSTQSVQAQTLANFEHAKRLGLSLIPVVTKIDLPTAQPEETALNIATTFGFDPEDCIMTSAKKKIGIDQVLQAVVDRLPPPSKDCGDSKGNLKARIVDSWYEEKRGLIILLQIVSGFLREGNRILAYASSREYGDEFSKDVSVQEIGLLTPSSLRTRVLYTGQVGYVVSGMRSTKQARIGDTIYTPSQWSTSDPIIPLDGYAPAKQMLFSSIFPVDSTQIETLFTSVDKLCLNDNSVSVTKDQSASLGSGLRCGFLGFLHMEVFMQRLQDEFNMSVIVTSPSVPYIVQNNRTMEVKEIRTVEEFPNFDVLKDYTISEPFVSIVLVTPRGYYGEMVDVLKDRRAENIDIHYLDDGTIKILALVPWQEVVCDMYDHIKKKSSGYANFNYTEDSYRPSSLSKVEIAINGVVCEALSFVTHTSKSHSQGKTIAEKLKESLSRQQFEIIIQAKVGNKILARERLAPFRKDVLASGKGTVIGQGDFSRKKKLLEKQKEGKKRAKMVGRVEVSQEAFWAVLNRES